MTARARPRGARRIRDALPRAEPIYTAPAGSFTTSTLQGACETT
jgi:hypothetical protein